MVRPELGVGGDRDERLGVDLVAHPLRGRRILRVEEEDRTADDVLPRAHVDPRERPVVVALDERLAGSGQSVARLRRAVALRGEQEGELVER